MNLNLPTKLTVLRLLLIPPILVLTASIHPWARVCALVLFVVASLTDYYDGKLARESNSVTTLGKFLDPLADKLLISSILIMFIQIDEFFIPAWMVVLIIGREFFITGLRTLAVSQGRVISASPAGKFKTTSQMVSIILIYIILITSGFLTNYFNESVLEMLHEVGRRKYLAQVLLNGPYWLMALTTLFTIVSGYIYLKDNLDLFSTGKK